MKICPSCNARVQEHERTCPSCDRVFEALVPRQTMMGIPAFVDEESDAAVGQGRTVAAPRSTLFGLPAITAEEGAGDEYDARTAMVSAADLPFGMPEESLEEDDSTRQVDAAKLQAAFQAQKGGAKATAFGLPSPVPARSPAQTPVAFEQPDDQSDVLSAWGLAEESSEELATQVISPADFSDPGAGGGDMSVKGAGAPRGESRRLHTLMGMSLEEESDLMGGGAMRMGGAQADADGAPTQAMSLQELRAGAEKLQKGKSLRDRLKKGMEKAQREPLPTPSDLRTDVMPGHVVEPLVEEQVTNPFERSSNRDTPRSGVYRVARRARSAGTSEDASAGMAEDSGVLGSAGPYQVGSHTSEAPFGQHEASRTAFPAGPAGATPQGERKDLTPGSGASASSPWERTSGGTGPRFGITLPEPGSVGDVAGPTTPETPVAPASPSWGGGAPAPGAAASGTSPLASAPHQETSNTSGLGSPSHHRASQPPSAAGFGETASPGTQPAANAPLGGAFGAPSTAPGGHQPFGAMPAGGAPPMAAQPQRLTTPRQTEDFGPSPQVAPVAPAAAGGAEALVATLQKVCGVMAGLTLVLATGMGVMGGAALTGLALVPVVMGLVALLLPFLPVSRRIASVGFALVALGSLSVVVTSVMAGAAELALFVQFGGGLLAAFAAAFPLVLKLVKPSNA
ncbi:hypothetical protein DL240_07825 [Lujinxingia litoralis]|uniref:Uncharacterized protein n=1 Tax=Lujinxingia litoralis TaxID=2211119 RepID=A0A328C6X0_9DELT|nr:hypothetical protein [Lujinxingia litoralis]RAL22792.1 hypothetical protein DL240_07825 [Lujinxingia litoralis]